PVALVIVVVVFFLFFFSSRRRHTRSDRDWSSDVCSSDLSVHDVREAEAAHAGGADYLLVGPVFSTATHPDRAPLGLARLQEIVGIGLPVIAIGGVTPERMPELMAGAAIHGVAAIRALWHAADPADAARRLLQELNG